MFGALQINNILKNDSAVIALVDKTNKGVPAIFEDMMLPPSLTVNSKTINFYTYTPTSLSDDYIKMSYSVNCRAASFKDSIAIAKAVINALNRVSYNRVYFTCKTMVVIPPSDERDNYNTPIEVLIKAAIGDI
jgi:hypothetical protein